MTSIAWESNWKITSRSSRVWTTTSHWNRRMDNWRSKGRPCFPSF